MKIICYHPLNASAGFNLLACNAGKTPEKIPIKNEKLAAPINNEYETDTFIIFSSKAVFAPKQL